MKVSLVALTKCMIPGHENMTSEELIVYTARVSNPENQLNTMTSERLIAFLIRKAHWSPFEQADMTLEIVTSRAIAAQILRHWSMRFQEFSMRYAEAVDLEPVELRRANASDRQSSTEVFDPILKTDSGVDIFANQKIKNYLDSGQDLYRELLDAGAAKECARMVLPLTTSTTIYVKGNVRSWIFYLLQRTDAHAQLEHQHVANEVENIFAEQFPNIYLAITAMRERPRKLIEALEKIYAEIVYEDLDGKPSINEEVYETLPALIEKLKKEIS